MNQDDRYPHQLTTKDTNDTKTSTTCPRNDTENRHHHRGLRRRNQDDRTLAATRFSSALLATHYPLLATLSPPYPSRPTFAAWLLRASTQPTDTGVTADCADEIRMIDPDPRSTINHPRSTPPPSATLYPQSSLLSFRPAAKPRPSPFSLLPLFLPFCSKNHEAHQSRHHRQ
jgi:hypothetical protein